MMEDESLHSTLSLALTLGRRMWLKLEDDPPRLRLTWGSNAGALMHYYIDAESFDGTATAALECLGAMSEDARNGAAVRVARVRELAYAGSQIWWSLFDKATQGNKEPVPPQRIAALKQRIETMWHEGDKILTISVDPTLHSVWPIVYPRNEDDIPNPADSLSAHESLAVFKDFWCLRYDMVVTLSGVDSVVPAGPSDRANFRMVSLIHDAALQVGVEALPEEDRDELNRLINLPDGRYGSLSEVRRKAASLSSKQLLLHFFGHRYGGTFVTAEKFDILELRKMLSRISESDVGMSRPQRLLFVNACSGLPGAGSNNLRTVVNEPGFCGLISTEADVPTGFAALYGKRLLSMLASKGESLSAAIKAVNQDPELWPLSLLYGCYADRTFRAAPENA